MSDAKKRPAGFDATWLEGTLELLQARKRWLWKAPLTALLVGLAAGLLARVAGFTPDDLNVLCVLGTLATVLGAPMLAAGGISLQLSPQAGSASRHDELALLPLGRWAFPAALELGSVWLTASMLAAGWAGFVNGAGILPDARDVSPTVLEAGALVTLNVWAAVTGALALHGSAAAATVAVPLLLPLVLGVSVHVMGHGIDESIRYVQAWSLALSAFSLVLPFIVQSWPLHVLSTSKATPQPDQVDQNLLAGGVAALLFLLVGLHGWMAATLAFTAVTTIRRARSLPRTPRRPPRGLRIACLALLPVVLPLAAFGLGADALRDARADRGEALQDGGPVQVSPGGRFVALQRQALTGANTLSRVVVVDVTGERPTVVVPTTRFARLDACGWSRDGRWLVVHDDRVGRLRVPSTSLDSIAQQLGGPRIPALIEGGVRAMTASVALDATTGEVRRLPRVELAPGWRTPDELARAELSLDGTLALVGPRSRFELRRGEPAVQLWGYDEGWPLLAPLHEGDVWLESVEPPDAAPAPAPTAAARAALAEGDVRTGGRLPRRVLRSEGSKLVAVQPAAAPWQLVGPPEELATRVGDPLRRRYPVAPAATPQARIPVEGLRIFPRRSTADSILVRDVEGLVRVALPGGERRLLVGGVEQLHDGEGALFVRTAGGWAVVDPATFALRPVPAPRHLVPLALGPGGRVIAGAGHRPTTVVEPDGRTRPLIP